MLIVLVGKVYAPQFCRESLQLNGTYELKLYFLFRLTTLTTKLFVIWWKPSMLVFLPFLMMLVTQLERSLIRCFLMPCATSYQLTNILQAKRYKFTHQWIAFLVLNHIMYSVIKLIKIILLGFQKFSMIKFITYDRNTDIYAFNIGMNKNKNAFYWILLLHCVYAAQFYICFAMK